MNAFVEKENKTPQERAAFLKCICFEFPTKIAVGEYFEVGWVEESIGHRQTTKQSRKFWIQAISEDHKLVFDTPLPQGIELTSSGDGCQIVTVYPATQVTAVYNYVNDLPGSEIDSVSKAKKQPYYARFGGGYGSKRRKQ